MLELTLEPEKFHTGIDRLKIADALGAEGIRPGLGWSNGVPMFKQNLWNIAPEKYRIASADNAWEHCCRKELVYTVHRLMTDRAAVCAFADAIEKVMNAYAG